MNDNIPELGSGTDTAETLKFKLDGDVFEAVSSVPAALMSDMMDLSGQFGFTQLNAAEIDVEDISPENIERLQGMASQAQKQTARLLSFLDQVLLDDSALLFAERLRSTKKPITLADAFNVWRYLVEQYGGRPTKQSVSSANGAGETGMSLMGGQLPKR
jgi:hypothetical protein